MLNRLLRLERLVSMADRFVVYENKSRERITVEKREQQDGTALWAIKTSNGCCINERLEWRYEGMPSSRTDSFLKKFRFKNLNQAISIAKKAAKVVEKEFQELAAASKRIVH